MIELEQAKQRLEELGLDQTSMMLEAQLEKAPPNRPISPFSMNSWKSNELQDKNETWRFVQSLSICLAERRSRNSTSLSSQALMNVWFESWPRWPLRPVQKTFCFWDHRELGSLIERWHWVYRRSF